MFRSNWTLQRSSWDLFSRTMNLSTPSQQKHLIQDSTWNCQVFKPTPCGTGCHSTHRRNKLILTAEITVHIRHKLLSTGHICHFTSMYVNFIITENWACPCSARAIELSIFNSATHGLVRHFIPHYRATSQPYQVTCERARATWAYTYCICTIHHMNTLHLLRFLHFWLFCFPRKTLQLSSPVT